MIDAKKGYSIHEMENILLIKLMVQKWKEKNEKVEG